MAQLEDMRIFLEVVDRGGFSAAASRLGLSKQMASRRVIALEERLGARLLVRTTRHLTPTELGRDYADRVRRILADIGEAEEAISSHVATPRGKLRLSAPLSFGISRLSPLLAGFMAQHQAVEIDIDLTDRFVDLVAEGYDMAVRIGVLADSTLIARKLAGTRNTLCASPEYLDRNGTPRSLADLRNHRCLLYRHRRGAGWLVRIDDSIETIQVAGAMQANNGDVLRDAAIAGLGIAQLPDFIIGDALTTGRLRTVLDEHAVEGAVYAVHPAHRQRSATVRALVDHLAVCLADPTRGPP